MNNKKLVLASIIAALSVSAPAYADWTKAADLLGGDKSKSASSGAFQTQEIMVTEFVNSSKLISEAQLLVAKSLKLDEMVSKIEAENKAKDGQSVDRLKTDRVNGQNLNTAIEKAIKDGEKLDDESKKVYLDALIQYAAGLVGTKSVIDAAPGFVSSAKDTIAAASMMQKLSVTKKLEDGMYIAKELPGYAKGLWDTSSLMLSFAKSNDIEVPADATKALTDISFD